MVKRLLMLTMIATVVCAVAVATAAFAAEETITISATVTGEQGISLSGASWTVGSIGTNSSSNSSTITATNTGSVTEALEVSATSTGDFTLGSTAGVDRIAIWGICASSNPGLTAANALTGTPGQTSENVNPASSLTVYMRYLSPTSITGGDSDGSATVTVSTAPAS